MLKTGNDKVFAYSIIDKDRELVVLASLDENSNQSAMVKTKYLKKDNLFSLVCTKKYPQLNQETISVELEPLEIQVYMISLASSRAM